MDSERLNVWLQLAGMIGIIASLLFVGLQLKQSQDIAIASQYSERSSESREFYHARAESPVQLEYLGNRHREHLKSAASYNPEMTAKEIGSFFLVSRAVLGLYDNSYYQYQAGFMTEEAFEPYRNLMATACSGNSFAKQVLENHPDWFRDSFVDYFQRVSCETN